MNHHFIKRIWYSPKQRKARGSSLCISHLSAKALISHSSISSSGTHVSTAIGPVSLAGSCFLGLNALDRRPFLCGVGVSTQEKQTIHYLHKMLPKPFQQWVVVIQVCSFWFLPFGVSLFPRGQMIFLMQYSERMPKGPTSLRFMISVVVTSVSVVSVETNILALHWKVEIPIFCWQKQKRR